jgi:hypothetical protein
MNGKLLPLRNGVAFKTMLRDLRVDEKDQHQDWEVYRLERRCNGQLFEREGVTLVMALLV